MVFMLKPINCRCLMLGVAPANDKDVYLFDDSGSKFV